MKVRELLSDETKWTKGWYGKTANGFRCNAEDERACQWCLGGAILRCAPDCFTAIALLEQVRTTLGLAADDMDLAKIGVWNDAPSRTFADVQQLVTELDI